MQITSGPIGRCADDAPGCFLQVLGLMRVLGVVSFFILLHIPAHAGQNVDLAWDPSLDPTVVGYKIYYGVVSGTDTNVVDVGNATSVTIPDLVEGMTYFFAATAYNMLGVESIFSNELSYTIPWGLPRVQLHAATGGQFILTLTGPMGHTYNIEATEDFTTWTVIETVILGASGSLDFGDTNAAEFPERFYRLNEVQP